jgi:hypothetical protein
VIVQIERNYGADADGNRGITEYFYEIDDDDYDDIVEQLEETGGNIVHLRCPYSDEMAEFEVDRKVYIAE